MKAGGEKDWEGGCRGTVLTLYQRFSESPRVPLAIPSPGRSAGVGGECMGTKGVPSPTSPLLHNTPKAGIGLGQSSRGGLRWGTVLLYSDMMPLIVSKIWFCVGSDTNWWMGKDPAKDPSSRVRTTYSELS